MSAARAIWARRQRLAPYGFLAPLVAVLGVFFVGPLGHSLVLSAYITTGPHSRRFVGLGNYWFLIAHDRVFWLAALNTVAFTAAFLLIQIPASLGLAMLLNHRELRFKSALRFCFFSTYLVGPVFMAIVFFAVLGSRLSRAGWVMPGILLAALWLSVGYGMIYFLAALQGVDETLYEAAELDGVGKWAGFWNVTVPGIWPVLIFLVMVGTIGGFQLFELPYVLLQGPGPGYRGLTIVMYLYSTAFERGDLGYSAAIGWLLVLMLAVVSAGQLVFARAVAQD